MSSLEFIKLLIPYCNPWLLGGAAFSFLVAVFLVLAFFFV